MSTDRRLSHAALGDRLYLSEVTVKSHTCSLLPKARARDQMQAVILAYQAELVPPRQPLARGAGLAALAVNTDSPDVPATIAP